MCTCAVRPRLSPRSFYGSLIFLRLVFVRRKPHRDLQDVLHYMDYMLYAVHAPSERPTYRVTCMCNDRWQCNSIAFWQLLSAEHMVCYVPPKLESPQVSIDVSFLLLGQLLEGLSALLMWEYCDEHENYGYLRYRAWTVYQVQVSVNKLYDDVVALETLGSLALSLGIRIDKQALTGTNPLNICQSNWWSFCEVLRRIIRSK